MPMTASPQLKRIVLVVLSFIIGLNLSCLVVTTLVTPWLNFLEAPEIRNYEAGRPVFDHPVTETYAKVMQKQLEEKIQRDGILKRWRASHSSASV
jgi:hypothetical protein